MSYLTSRFQHIFRRLRRYLGRLILILTFILLVTPEWPPFFDETYQLRVITTGQRFNYVTWEIEALTAKLEAALLGGHHYLSDTDRSTLVLTYLDWLRQSQQLDAEINAIFANPDITNPQQVSATQRATNQQLHQQMEIWQPIVEGILQEQVADILVQEGFAIGGAAWPPVQFRLTPLPQLLIVSPRERIEQIHNISLHPTVNTATAVTIETTVTEQLGRSPYVTRIGGVGTYPAMLAESANINWLVATIAHEWAHHWLTLHPLGLNYNTTPYLRNLNETVAGMVGNEIGPQVIAKYYPEFVPSPPPPPTTTDDPNTTPPPPPPFDFRAEMALTRAQADRLLAANQIDAAEIYMEERRQLFLKAGYNLRRLNQAYFAFHGAYAATPGGASGATDPIGPSTRNLRATSPNLKSFLNTIAAVTTLEDLHQLSPPPTP
ncbi:MAG TPA: hypothetical protein VLL52_10835 [Anaerolineae bacterium]|nr:hypothetical protein [Anaerolineae bacterium]